jgi:predicted CXXCH cytochrome family protein
LSRGNNREKARGRAEGLRVLILILSLGVFVFGINMKPAMSEVKCGLHDLSILCGDTPFQFETTEVCSFCHTPHGANINQSYNLDPGSDTNTNGIANGAYLWNRRTPDRSFQLYRNSTLSSVANAAAPGLLSVLCLSCHDGIGAMNVLLSYPADGQRIGGTGHLMGSGGELDPVNQFGDMDAFLPLNIAEGTDCTLGGGTNCTDTTPDMDLANDHPIGFIYNSAQVLDSGLKPLASLPASIKKRFTDVTDGSLECSTCHDPHKTNNSGMRNKFLVMDNEYSALCLGCHLK